MKKLIYLLVAIFTFSTAFSAEIRELIEFHPNTTAKSSEVNQNFNTLKDAINDNNSNIQSLQNGLNETNSNVEQLQESVGDHETRITNLENSTTSQEKGIKTINGVGNAGNESNVNVNLNSPKGSLSITPKASDKKIEIDISGQLLNNLDIVFTYLKERALKCTATNFRYAMTFFSNDIDILRKLNEISKKARENVDTKSFNDDNTFITAIDELYTFESELSSLLDKKVDENDLNAFNDILTEIQTAINKENVLKAATLQDELCFYVLEFGKNLYEKYNCNSTLNCLFIAFRDVATKFSSPTANQIKNHISNVLSSPDNMTCDSEQNLKDFISNLDFQGVSDEVQGLATTDSYNNYVNAVNQVNDELSNGTYDSLLDSLAQLCSATQNLEKVALATVPNLIGLNINDAKTQIAKAGLVVGTVTIQYDDTKSEGTVLSQDPLPGVKVSPNTPVNLVISTSQAITVPNLIGLNINDAKTQITKAGLVVGNITTRIDDTKKAGTVLSQDPLPGVKVAPNTPVNLVISKRSSILE